MKDIETAADIKMLVDKFYKQVITDDLIGPFFTKVVELDLDKHVPVICEFWETILFGSGKYQGNPMLKHIELNKKSSLHPEHFAKWLELWENTITANFNGPKATEAIQRAGQIAELMKYKIQQSTTTN
jgi:hemoglobin